MIQVTNTTQTVEQTSKTKATTQTSTLSYEQTSKDIKDPNSLSYDEISQLTREKIDETYKDMEEFRKQAYLLYRAANYSTDDTLNQSMLAQAKTLDTEEQKNSFSGMMFWTARMDKNGNFPAENLGFKLGIDGMPIWDKNRFDAEFPRLNIDFQSDKEVLAFIDVIIVHMEKNYDKGLESNNFHQTSFSSNNINSLHGVKNIFEEKMKEKNTLLKEFTKSTKPQALEELKQENENNKIDYSNYSIKELREIPYEEAAKNHNIIKQRIEKLREGTLSESQRDEAIALEFQLAKINYSDNEQLNKAMFTTMQNSPNSFDAMVIDSEIQVNLQDYYYGKNVEASFVVSNNPIHANKELTREQLNSINVENFISSMITRFTKGYNDAPLDVKAQYESIVDGYKNLRSNFNNLDN